LDVFSREQKALKEKLAAIEKRIIVGGKNLLEKAEDQARLLEEFARQLNEQNASTQS